MGQMSLSPSSDVRTPAVPLSWAGAAPLRTPFLWNSGPQWATGEGPLRSGRQEGGRATFHPGQRGLGAGALASRAFSQARWLTWWCEAAPGASVATAPVGPPETASLPQPPTRTPARSLASPSHGPGVCFSDEGTSFSRPSLVIIEIGSLVGMRKQHRLLVDPEVSQLFWQVPSVLFFLISSACFLPIRLLFRH